MPDVDFDLRTDVLSIVFSSKLNKNQLLFVMYLYRITFECKCLETKIPSLNEIADALGIDKGNFRRDVAELIEQDIIKREGKRYGFNLDFKIIARSRQTVRCKRLMNKYINRSLYPEKA